ncbi:MAG: FMN-binding protein [Eubacteriales bacterium]|nr:FMN-binding protein [Eubacteriales bacterium]
MSKDNGYMPAIILTIIVLITTGLLAFTSSITQATRDAQAVAADNANRTLICPLASTFEPVELALDSLDTTGVSEAYLVKDDQGAILGYLYKSQFRGYAGDVPVLVAIDSNNMIIRALALENGETPGLGKKIADDSFIGQYVDLDATKVYTVKPNETDKVLLDSIAGATISSNAVTHAVNQASALHLQIASEVK